MTLPATLASQAAWLWQTDSVARWVALVLWICLSVMLSIPAYRRLFGVPRYADDLLFAIWLLALNRICFSVQALVHSDVLGDFSRWYGIVAGLFMAWVASGYIRPLKAGGHAGA